MKKTEMAKLTFRLQQLESIQESSDEKLIEVIQHSFSALATSNPNLAVSVIEQLIQQKRAMVELAEERRNDEKEYVKEFSKKLRDSLEFEEE